MTNTKRRLTLIVLALSLGAPLCAHADAFEDDVVVLNTVNTALALDQETATSKGATHGVAPQAASDTKACAAATKDDRSEKRRRFLVVFSSTIALIGAFVGIMGMLMPSFD